MKYIITESQYKLLTESQSDAVSVMGDRVNEYFNYFVNRMKKIGVVDDAAKAGVNIINPVEQIKNYVLSLLPKKFTDITTTGNGGNEFRTNVINKIYEITKSELSKISYLKRKAAKVLMLATYGSKEKFIETELKEWGNDMWYFIWNMINTPSEPLNGVSVFKLDKNNPKHQKYKNYLMDSLKNLDNISKDTTRQILSLVWDSL